MRNTLLIMTTLLGIAAPPHVFAHTGHHSGNWVVNLVHFLASPNHLPMTIPGAIILGLAAHFVWKYRQFRRADAK